MPCYTAWNDYLTQGTPEYMRAEEEVRAKLEAVKHIVIYYYSAFDHKLPVLPDDVCIDPFRQPRGHQEVKIREMICHHFACDGIHFTTLYDVCSLLDESAQDERAYLAVILPSANLIRSDMSTYGKGF